MSAFIRATTKMSRRKPEDNVVADPLSRDRTAKLLKTLRHARKEARMLRARMDNALESDPITLRTLKRKP